MKLHITFTMLFKTKWLIVWSILAVLLLSRYVSADTHTFGGNDLIQPAKLEPSATNQVVLFGLLRPRWATNSGNFSAFQHKVDAEFDHMNEFWKEATFGKTSFDKQYLTQSIIDLPMSQNFYYHGFQQRDIQGAAIGSTVNFPQNKSLKIESDGQPIDIEFTTGTWSRTSILSKIIAAMAASDPTKPSPTFEFSDTGTGFHIRSQRTYPQQGILEISGDALSYIGFGTTSFYHQVSSPAMIIFSTPLDAQLVNFPTAQTLTVTTLGTPTNAQFAAGTYSVTQIVAAIQAAYPGVARQQPFTVEAVGDPVDSSRQILVFKTHVDPNGDHGYNLTVDGSARTTLGLSNTGVIRRYEPEVLNGEIAIQDGFNKYASTLPAGTDIDAVFKNARMFVGIMLDVPFRAHESSWDFHIAGHTFNVNYFASNFYAGVGAVFAHETGHALQLPDLYKRFPDWIGTEPGNWDIMDCSGCDAHPTAWLKARRHKLPADQTGAWLDADQIAQLSPPPGAGTKSESYILSPVESPWISSNPFNSSHPNVRVVHGIEIIPTDPADVIVIENRQRGPYVADHLGDAVDYSQDLPGEGVIVYQGRRINMMGVATFLPVNFLTPYADPLNQVGEEFTYPLTNWNKVIVKIQEKLLNPDRTGGSPSYSYLVNVQWGTGSFFDAAITPWSAPPWESIDIWVDNRAQNDWGKYTYHDGTGNPTLNGDNVAVNQVNRIFARVHNLGDVPINQAVDVIWRIAIPQVAGGEIETELGRVSIRGGIPAKSAVITPPLEWEPHSSNEGHVCIKAEIVTIPGELNGTLDKSAQENITQWFSKASSPFSPVTFSVITKNPFVDRDTDLRLYVPDVPPGWTVTVEDALFRLAPDEERAQEITIVPDGDFLFQTYGPEIERQGYIDSFMANIEAQIVVGDVWLRIGGVSAIVHPVNADSRLTLNPDPSGTYQPGLVVILGKLETHGHMYPRLEGREIHARLIDERGQQTWQQLTTDSNGKFAIPIPREYKGLIQGFYGGGKGIDQAVSNEVAINTR